MLLYLHVPPVGPVRNSCRKAARLCHKAQSEELVLECTALTGKWLVMIAHFVTRGVYISCTFINCSLQY
jgi:hypothetical protein